MTFKDIVGENIRHYRKLKGYTIKEVASKVGITEATMQKYEAGNIRRVDVEMLSDIANALEVDPGLLTGWTVLPSAAETIYNQAANSPLTQTLTPHQQYMLDCIEQLNYDGQEKLIEQIKLLLEVPKYRSEKSEVSKAG